MDFCGVPESLSPIFVAYPSEPHMESRVLFLGIGWSRPDPNRNRDFLGQEHSTSDGTENVKLSAGARFLTRALTPFK